MKKLILPIWESFESINKRICIKRRLFDSILSLHPSITDIIFLYDPLCVVGGVKMVSLRLDDIAYRFSQIDRPLADVEKVINQYCSANKIKGTLQSIRSDCKKTVRYLVVDSQPKPLSLACDYAKSQLPCVINTDLFSFLSPDDLYYENEFCTYINQGKIKINALKTSRGKLQWVQTLKSRSDKPKKIVLVSDIDDSLLDGFLVDRVRVTHINSNIIDLIALSLTTYECVDFYMLTSRPNHSLSVKIKALNPTNYYADEMSDEPQSLLSVLQNFTTTLQNTIPKDDLSRLTINPGMESLYDNRLYTRTEENNQHANKKPAFNPKILNIMFKVIDGEFSNLDVILIDDQPLDIQPWENNTSLSLLHGSVINKVIQYGKQFNCEDSFTQHDFQQYERLRTTNRHINQNNTPSSTFFFSIVESNKLQIDQLNQKFNSTMLSLVTTVCLSSNINLSMIRCYADERAHDPLKLQKIQCLFDQEKSTLKLSM